MNWINKNFLTTIISFLLLTHGQALAQEIPPLEDNQKVFDAQSFSKDIRQLTLQYRGELEDYRSSEKEYKILKQQYFQLETLASLEKSVRATQAAMVARANVLRTYIRLLRFHLLAQAGIELPEKQAAQQNLLDTLSKIEQHQQKLAEPLDKPSIANVAVEFKELFSEIEESVYRVLALLTVGKLQTVHDKALVLTHDMEEQLATAGGALKSAERKRSFDETNRVLSSLKGEFDLVEAKFSDSSDLDYKEVYQFANDRLSRIYSSLAKALLFLEELLKI